MKLVVFLLLLSLGVVCETARFRDIPKETKLLLQIAELEMQLTQSQYENSKHVQKALEVGFKTAQGKYADLQTAECKAIGGKVKEDCTFTSELVSLKEKSLEVKK